MYSAFLATAVTNDLLNLADATGCSLTQMQVQKLVYFSHGWHLALRNEALTMEPFEAWDYGPVIRRLWEHLRVFGSRPVTEKIEDFTIVNGKFKRVVTSIEGSDEPSALSSLQVVKGVWDKYHHLSGSALSALTHVQDGPWFAARKEQRPFISNEAIKDYFEKLKRA